MSFGLRNILLMLAVAGAAAATDHTSKLMFATCSADEPLQRFSVDIDGPGKTGEIRDDETGRCIGVRGCSVALQFAPGGVPSGGTTFGEAVLDACGSECSGKATQWKQSQDAAGLVFVSEADTSACFALCVPATASIPPPLMLCTAVRTVPN